MRACHLGGPPRRPRSHFGLTMETYEKSAVETPFGVGSWSEELEVVWHLTRQQERSLYQGLLWNFKQKADSLAAAMFYGDRASEQLMAFGLFGHQPCQSCILPDFLVSHCQAPNVLGVQTQGAEPGQRQPLAKATGADGGALLKGGSSKLAQTQSFVKASGAHDESLLKGKCVPGANLCFARSQTLNNNESCRLPRAKPKPSSCRWEALAEPDEPEQDFPVAPQDIGCLVRDADGMLLPATVAFANLAKFKHDSKITAKFHQYYLEHCSELETAHSRQPPLGQAAVALTAFEKVQQAGSAVFVPSLFWAADSFAKPPEACVKHSAEVFENGILEPIAAPWRCCEASMVAARSESCLQSSDIVSETSEGNQPIDGASQAASAANVFRAPEEVVHISGVMQQACAQHQEAEKDGQEADKTEPFKTRGKVPNATSTGPEHEPLVNEELVLKPVNFPLT